MPQQLAEFLGHTQVRGVVKRGKRNDETNRVVGVVAELDRFVEAWPLNSMASSASRLLMWDMGAFRNREHVLSPR